MSDVMPIGLLSRKTGVKIPTIRYYESVGLLRPPPRSEGNRRLYGPAAVDRLRFIRNARVTGLRLRDIAGILALRDSGQAPCGRVEALVAQLNHDIDSARRAVT